MRKLLIWVAAAASMLASRANAATFHWTYLGTQQLSAGTLTATLASGNQFTVTSITGLFDGNTITALLPQNSTSPYGDDNDNSIYFPTSPYEAVDMQGIGFATTTAAAQAATDRGTGA
jgi:hypothetical protein